LIHSSRAPGNAETIASANKRKRRGEEARGTSKQLLAAIRRYVCQAGINLSRGCHRDLKGAAPRAADSFGVSSSVFHRSMEASTIILALKNVRPLSELLERGFDPRGLNQARVHDIESRRHARQRRCPIELSIREDLTEI